MRIRLCPGHRDLGSALGGLLPYYLREIHIVRFGPGFLPGLVHLTVPYQQVFPILPLQYGNRLFQVVHPVYFGGTVFHGLQGRHRGKYAAVQAQGNGHFGVGQGPRHRTDGCIQAKFAHHQEMPQPRQLPLPRRGYDAQGYGQVVAAAALVQVGRGKVYHYLLPGDMEIPRLKGGHGAQQAFLHRRVRQPHQMYADSAVYLDLHFHRDGIYPDTLRSNNIYQHNPFYLYLCRRCSTE